MWSLRNKVLLGVLLVITVIVICGVTLVYKKDAEMIQKDYCQNLYYRVEQAGKYFDNTMSSIYEISAKMAYEKELIQLVQKYKEQQTEESAARLSQLLADYKTKNMEISSICVYLRELDVLITSEEYPVRVERPMVALRDSTFHNPTLMGIPYKKEGHMLSFVNTLNTGEVEPSVVMVNVQERSVYYNYLDYLDSSKVTTLMLVDQEEKVISAKERSLIGTSFSQPIFHESTGQGIVKGENGEEIGLSYRAPFSQYVIRLVVSTDEILVQLRSLRFFVLTLSIVFIAAAFLFSYFSTLFIYKPLSQLTETVKSVGQGDLNLRYKVTTKDEVGTLGTNFNNMLDQINVLFKQLIREEELKKDAELDALQYQIRPHFMYNTLNTIKCYALTKGEKEVAELIANFADLLRTAINKNGVFITLQEELDIVDKYVKLQQFRHGDVFAVFYQVEDAKECFIPRLILQPFVENSIEHGFDMGKTDNEIVICASVEDGILNIKISDNGIGMPQELIDKLLNDPAKKVTGMSNIGISNVKERLSLYFGDHCQVNMMMVNKKLEVSISMPAITDAKQLCEFGRREGESICIKR
ncbi:two-component system sensor histidine kinase YesM [Aequitasia blattaphilus]|uniref:Sensor histidine kinase n=1 Tax=Aequitasia blattaphilus TaxID=2949332 RepID=A0ABT1ED19_9FIRM|nr:sensor histidine kinase [Aequitasia blattaphilus]MCP1103569.1 sensor histidine kinase [Aequitasia blattaphilus]MCR8616209.1 sensor histidine kinase [Aequitasia blattaphilus]